MTTPLNVLILEDHPDDAELIVIELERAGFTPTWRRVDTSADYRAQLSQDYDVILSDYTMPQFNALNALEILRMYGPDIPFIVVTGSISEEVAVECMKQGASDYLLKDRLGRLGVAVKQALERQRLREEKRRAEEAARLEAQVSAALAQAGRELMQSLTSSVVLERLCRITAEVLASNDSTTYLRSAEDETYVPIAGWGWTSAEWEVFRLLRFPHAAFGLINADLEREDIIQTSIENFAERAPLQAKFLVQRGVSWVIVMALRQGGQIIGVQTAGYHDRREPCSLQQERIAHGIVQLASLALSNVSLLEEVQRANRVKSEFLATMSHELRTPLNIILGYLNIVLGDEETPLPAHQVRALRRVEKSAKDLTQLIMATLDMSRLEAGRMPVVVQVVQLPMLMDELTEEMRELLEKPGVVVRWEIETGLPSLRTDPEKLKIILKNLLNNAAKFTEVGQIIVSARRVDDGVNLNVTDTGIGIAPEILPHIFELFRQGDSSMTRRYDGVGLGLYIVRRFVDLLKGTITVKSVVGQGSTFCVWLPSEGHGRS